MKQTTSIIRSFQCIAVTLTFSLTVSPSAEAQGDLCKKALAGIAAYDVGTTTIFFGQRGYATRDVPRDFVEYWEEVQDQGMPPNLRAEYIEQKLSLMLSSESWTVRPIGSEQESA